MCPHLGGGGWVEIGRLDRKTWGGKRLGKKGDSRRGKKKSESFATSWGDVTFWTFWESFFRGKENLTRDERGHTGGEESLIQKMSRALVKGGISAGEARDACAFLRRGKKIAGQSSKKGYANSEEPTLNDGAKPNFRGEYFNHRGEKAQVEDKGSTFTSRQAV